ncbi:3-dehydroquinate synthase [bacterium]|nr:3-dehydroquinate synthase [bacterium]
MPHLTMNLGQHKYDILIEAGLLKCLPMLLERKCKNRRIALVADQTVMQLYGSQAVKTLLDKGYAIRAFDFPPGESSKNHDILHELYTEIIQWGIRRSDIIIAMGGGVTGDLAGFIAATLHRGMDFIQIPTTLLAQIDSSIGGKTGINHPLGKNLIGAFHQPVQVLIDPETLHTLPERELWAGMGEIAKYALMDSSLFDFLEPEIETLSNLNNMEAMVSLIVRCCRIKADIVEKDQYESGSRRILNLGHTLGHALELCTQYNYFRHGEAVLWGLDWAVRISEKTGRIDAAESLKARRFFERIQKQPIPQHISSAQLTEAMSRDKKQTENGLQWILIDKIGTPVIETANDIEELTSEWLQNFK